MSGKQVAVACLVVLGAVALLGCAGNTNSLSASGGGSTLSQVLYDAGSGEDSQNDQGGPPPCSDPIPTQMQTRLLEKFANQGIDASGDGTLTCDEIKAFFEANPDLRPHGHGPGGPPPCSDPIPAQMQTRLLEKFGEQGIDANGDGTLTCDEIKSFFQANPDLRPHGPGGPPMHGPFGPPPCSDPIPTQMQTRLLEEFGAQGIDANGDGTLTCDEIKAFFQANPDLRPPGCGEPPPGP
jgi:hypothetical protein